MSNNIKENIKSSFLGGINQQLDSTRIPEDSYFLLINGRTREDVVTPIKAPLLLSNQVPQGNYQAIYSVANYGIILIDGKAYVKDYELNPNSGFSQIPNFQLSSTVDRI